MDADPLTLFDYGYAVFAAGLTLVVFYVVWRVVRRAEPQEPSYYGDDPNLTPPMPDPPQGEDLAAITRDAVETSSESAPRLGALALRAAVPDFSEARFLAIAQRRFAEGYLAHGSGDASALRPTFAEGAIESLMSGREGLTEVRDILVGPTRMASALVDDVWAHIEVTMEALLTELRHGEEHRMQAVERWAFARRTDRDDQWQVRQVLDRTREPLIHPPIERGHQLEHGSSLPTVRAPDIEATERDFASRHPQWDLDAFRRWVSRAFAEVEAARGDRPGPLPYVAAPLLGGLAWSAARLLEVGLHPRVEDAVAEGVELCRLERDAHDDLLTIRVRGRCRQWLEDAAGQTVDGAPEDLREFSEYWSLMRPSAGAMYAHDERQGWVLWQITSDEDYNG